MNFTLTQLYARLNHYFKGGGRLVHKNIKLKYGISHEQSIDNSFLSSHKKFNSIGQKTANLWPKNLCPYICQLY